jgi:CspA family cold shock protein
MATGTVKWFNATKGYGFIAPQDGGKDVFVHISALEAARIGNLKEGQRISYEVVMQRGICCQSKAGLITDSSGAT